MSSRPSFEKNFWSPAPSDQTGRSGLFLEKAACCLRRDGVLVFPTETFYSLGCLAASAAGIAHVYQIKRRPVHKPLPLLAADMAQVDAVAHLAALPQELHSFWPGPLTVLLPARANLPHALVNPQGLVAVRVTSHPLATELARRAGGPLTASSANMAGGRPVCRPEDLDPDLLAALAQMGAAQNEDRGGFCGLLPGGPLPAGGKPSTVVLPLPERACGRRRLRLIRAGAVGAAALEATGLELLE